MKGPQLKWVDSSLSGSLRSSGRWFHLPDPARRVRIHPLADPETREMHQLADKGADKGGGKGEGQVEDNETGVVKAFIDVSSKTRDGSGFSAGVRTPEGGSQ